MMDKKEFKKLPSPNFQGVNEYNIEGITVLLEFYPKDKMQKEKFINSDMWKISIKSKELPVIWVPISYWKDGIQTILKFVDNKEEVKDGRD